MPIWKKVAWAKAKGWKKSASLVYLMYTRGVQGWWYGTFQAWAEIAAGCAAHGCGVYLNALLKNWIGGTRKAMNFHLKEHSFLAGTHCMCFNSQETRHKKCVSADKFNCKHFVSCYIKNSRSASSWRPETNITGYIFSFKVVNSDSLEFFLVNHLGRKETNYVWHLSVFSW